MLVIRQEQMQVFRKYMLEGFERRMLDYLAGRFPEVCPPENEKAVRESVRKGIERAKTYGITIEYDVARYVELMFLFSEDFDTSPDTSWAMPILKDPDLGGHVKMDRLCEKAAQKAGESGS